MGLLDTLTLGQWGSLSGADDAEQGYANALAAQQGMYGQAREDLAPWREFGGAQLKELQNWLAGGGMADPTSADVMASPGYRSRQEAIENSAISRGGLFSGNSANMMSEFGANEFDRLRARRGEDLARRLSLLGPGMTATGQGSSLAARQGNALANLYVGQGQQQAALSPLGIGSGLFGAYLGASGGK